MKTFVAMCIMGLLMGVVHSLTKHTIHTLYYNQALATSPSSTQHDTEYRVLPCDAQACAPHHDTRKVSHPTLPKQELGKVIRIVNTINDRNQRAAQAGDLND